MPVKPEPEEERTCVTCRHCVKDEKLTATRRKVDYTCALSGLRAYEERATGGACGRDGTKWEA